MMYHFCIICKTKNKKWKNKSLKYSLIENLGKKKTKIGVEISGFEPEASRMQSERSTTELYPHVASTM